jgi:FMN phosphatase YigB (HAD superfamily)
MNTQISLVVTDLDNTIYDWMTAFVPALYEMVGEAAKILQVSESILLDDLRDVHQRHGDSEHPFALLETRTVTDFRANSPNSNPKVVLDPAFHAFNRVRRNNLRLYDGVLLTLEQLRTFGIPVVAYTDARVINSLTRLNLLNVKRLFSALYAPQHSELSLIAPELKDGFVHLLDKGDRKPNPKTLIDICADFSVTPQTVLYVGDSIARDVYMANRASINVAWAKYGTVYDSSLWPKLVRVTHWTDVDVSREKELKDLTRGVKPDIVLDRFDRILDLYQFAYDKTEVSVGVP